MDVIVLKMWYDGRWISLRNGNMDYVDGIATVIVVRNDISFDQLTEKVYATIGKSSNEYDISLKTVFKSAFGTDGREGFPVDITNDEMVKALLVMNSQAGNHGLTPFYVTAYPKIPIINEEIVNESLEFVPTTQSQTVGIEVEIGGSSYPPTWNDDSGYSPLNDEQINEGIELTQNRLVSPRECSGMHSKSFDPLTFMPPPTTSDWTAPNLVSESSSGGIFVGQLFAEKKVMYMELSMLAIRKKFEFKVAKSTKTRFDVHCASDSCKWRFRATRMNDEINVPWVVMRCDKIELHICHNDIFHNGHRQAKSRVVGHIIKDKFVDGRRIYSPNDIISDVNNDHCVKLSYQQAYRAKEAALELLRGSEEESYNLLNSYSFVLQQKNPGTVTFLMKNEEDNFMYYFLALGSCIKGFSQFIRPVIAVDGSHLKGKYRGTLFVATCLDGNNQLFVVAIGIGDTENDASWEWFMRRLFDVIGDVSDLVFISDRHKSIEKAVLRVFPSAEHGVCFYHVQGNLKSIFKMEPKAWKKFKLSYIAAAKEYDPVEFEKQMRGMWGMNPEAARYLEEDVGVRNWARSQFEGRRYSILTTNIAESLNSLMKEARKFPVTHMIEFFREKMQQWFYDRKTMGESMTTRLTSWAHNIVDERKKIAESMNVLRVSHHQYQVKGGCMREGFVDLNERTCSCRVFQLDQLVCAHTIAVCMFRRIDHVSLCSHFYLKESLLHAYEEPIIPVGDMASWDIPEEICTQKVFPPRKTTNTGRRKTLRVPSIGEETSRRNYRCTRCHEIGHNRKRCTNPIGDN